MSREGHEYGHSTCPNSGPMCSLKLFFCDERFMWELKGKLQVTIIFYNPYPQTSMCLAPRLVKCLDDKLQDAQRSFNAFAEGRLCAGTQLPRSAENPSCTHVQTTKNITLKQLFYMLVNRSRCKVVNAEVPVLVAQKNAHKHSSSFSFVPMLF